ncbi:MAG: radical SAM protein [Longimicrobiales bacterium]
MDTSPAAAGSSGPIVAIQSDAPPVAPAALDQLWIQVAGTVCNLRCTHCFISCAPENHAFWFMSLTEVLPYLEEADRLGVKEYYLTGGEPFMNRELVEILGAVLERGPATVLTNATLLRRAQIARLAAIERASPYSLEIRVSLDGPDAGSNDPIRGAGTFERACDGVRLLVEHGFLPIITAVQVWDDPRDEEVRGRFMELLRGLGDAQPRLKILPALHIGREALRSRGYDDEERVTAEMLRGFDVGELICSSARVATSRGIWVCPILLDAPDARMGGSLRESLRPYPLRHRACFTCWLHGAICSNFGRA